MITHTKVRVDITFCHRGLKYSYSVWQTSNIWYWEAAGNSQSATSEDTAHYEARRWIRDGQ
jgi:hypothetical protein